MDYYYRVRSSGVLENEAMSHMSGRSLEGILWSGSPGPVMENEWSRDIESGGTLKVPNFELAEVHRG